MGKGKKTSSGETVEHRISFEVQEKLEEFYTGGQVQVSKDGEHLLTCCGSAVKALHIDSGVVQHSFEEEEDLVICFVLSPDSKWLLFHCTQFLVVSWRSQQLKLYQWRGGEDGERDGGEEGEEEGETEERKEEQKKKKRRKCLRSWKPLQGAVVAMAIDPTSTLLATGSSSGIKVWDCVHHYCTHNLRPSGGLVGLLTFHPDPAHLTLFSSTATDTSIKVWDLKSSRCVSVMKGHVSAVTSLRFSGDNQFMISGGRDKVLHVWKLPQYSLHKTLPVFEAVEGLVVLPGSSGSGRRRGKKEQVDSLVVATAGDKGVIRLWDLVKGEMTRSLDPLPRPQSNTQQQSSMIGGEEEEEEEEEEGEGEGEGEGGVPQVYTDLLLCVSRGELVGVTYDHSIIFYDIATLNKQKQLLGYCDEILDMRFLGGPGPASRLAVVTNSEQVKVLTCGSLDWQLLHSHSRVVLSLDAFSPPPPLPPLLVSSSKDRTVRVWGEVEVDEGEEGEGSGGRRSEFVCKGVGSGHTEAVGAVAFGRLSGSFIVSGSQDCTIKLWGLKSLSKWEKGDPPVKLPTRYTQLAHDKDINGVDVSPNDKLMVTGSQDKTAKLWNVSDGSLVGVLRGHRRGIWSVQFSPVDQCVLTASADTTLKLWAVSDCSCLKTFEGHTMSVLKAVFITRGMQIASSGSDGLVKVWTVRTNECVTTLDQHTEKVWSIASCEDGSWLASGGADSLICLWKDVTEKVVAEKQEARDRQILQEQELSNYLQQRDYVQAVGVAINLDQPFRVYTILSEVLDDGGEDGVFKDTLSGLRPDQIHSVLRYLTKWNMNAKYSTVAQKVLSYILRTHTPEQLMTYGDLHSILEGLIPYTERHFQRLSRLLQLSMFVEYTWQCMKLPDQPSVSTTSSGHQPVASRRPKQSTKTDGDAVGSDVTVAAADSTTQDLSDEGGLFVEDRDPDLTLQLEHTTEATGGDESESEGASGSGEESGSGAEEGIVDSSVHQEEEEEEEGEVGVRDQLSGGSETEMGGRGQREGEKSKKKMRRRAKRGEGEEEGEEGEEGGSRCRINRRRRLLQKRRMLLQRRLKFCGGRQHRTLIHT